MRYGIPKPIRFAIGAACVRIARALNPQARIIVATVQRGGRRRSGKQAPSLLADPEVARILRDIDRPRIARPRGCA